jgi:hypothetical protein
MFLGDYVDQWKSEEKINENPKDPEFAPQPWQPYKIALKLNVLRKKPTFFNWLLQHYICTYVCTMYECYIYVLQNLIQDTEVAAILSLKKNQFLFCSARESMNKLSRFLFARKRCVAFAETTAASIN